MAVPEVLIPKLKITTTRLALYAACFLVLVTNGAFFRHVLTVYPADLQHGGFLASLTVGVTAMIMLFLTLFSSKYTTKFIVILLLLVSSLVAYFMDTYDVVIDVTMIQNIVQTNFQEAADLFSLRLLLYFILLGVLPAGLVYSMQLEDLPWKQAIIIKLRDAGIALAVVLGMVLLFSNYYADFFRSQKSLRYFANPLYYIYSSGKYITNALKEQSGVINPLGVDARIASQNRRRELIIVVIGEAARADHFSLNGYARDTNPLLRHEDIISFTNMYACGTTTAYSVPCMFSIYPRADYSDGKAASTENLLDVLRHAGVHVLWRDNNSSSKGVTARVEYEEFKSPATNPICDVECRDEGMLVGLQQYIDRQQTGDIVIILHQMGNHGPAYFKRYPPGFEKFTPVCKSNQLADCSKTEINNAFDNALLYTDYFLAKTITLLKHNTDRFAPAMLYFSDHGESLGDHGIYLHGLPYVIAPDEQKHIGAIFWFGDGFPIDKAVLRSKAADPFSHDNFFHTVLGLLSVETSVYDQRLDMSHL